LLHLFCQIAGMKKMLQISLGYHTGNNSWGWNYYSIRTAKIN
jgi:hypothetical protein